ncbi:MAG: hypothetical protein ACOYO1_04890 [Bacteroidales bacterium]
MKAKFNFGKTKKFFLFLFLFISFTSSSYAQEFFYIRSFGEYYYDWNFYNPFSYYKRVKMPKNLIKELKLKEQKVYFQDFKIDTATSLIEQKLYDNNGYESLIKRYTTKGKMYFHIEKENSENGRVLKEKYFDSKGKLKYWWEVIYDKKGNVIENKSSNNKGVLVYHTVNTINENGKITKCDSYHGKKHKLFSRMLYTYYPNGEKETTTQLDANGKIVKVWSYACSADGVERKIKKDTVQVCKIADYNKDGGFTITNRTLNEKGKMERTVSRFNKDSVQIEAYRYNNEDKIVYQNKTKITDNGWETEYTSYYVKHAKPSSIVHHFYNLNKELINFDLTSYKRNGKISKKYNSEYKGANQCLKTIYYKKGGLKIDFVKIYNYADSGLLNDVVIIDDKGRNQNKTRYQYN